MEWTCKPGSVHASTARDGHSSRMPIARHLKRSTRESFTDRTSPRERPEEHESPGGSTALCLTLLLVGFA